MRRSDVGNGESIWEIAESELIQFFLLSESHNQLQFLFTVSARDQEPVHPRKIERAVKGSLYLSACGTILPTVKNWGLINRWFRGLYQTEFQRGSSGLLTCKARTVARAT